MQELTVDGKMPDFNAISNAMKGHWSAYSKEKRRWTDTVVWLCREAQLRPVEAPVMLEFTWYAKDRRRDPDNIRSIGSKFIIDGLVKAGVLADDRWRNIVGFKDHFQIDKERPRCLVRIWPQEDEG